MKAIEATLVSSLDGLYVHPDTCEQDIMGMALELKVTILPGHLAEDLKGVTVRSDEDLDFTDGKEYIVVHVNVFNEHIRSIAYCKQDSKGNNNLYIKRSGRGDEFYSEEIHDECIWGTKIRWYRSCIPSIDAPGEGV